MIAHSVLAIPDTHLEVGLEPSLAYRTAKKFCRDYKPDVIVHLGDLLDLSYLSKFTANSPLLVEGRRYGSDCNLAERELAEWRGLAGRMEFIEGNHDNRVARYVERFPALEGHMIIQADYKIVELDIGFTEFNKVLSIGKLNFTHGWYYNKYHAMKHLNSMGDHIFYGHTHDHQAVVQPVRAKRDPHMAMSLGCLCELNPQWRRNWPTEWINGVGLFEVASSGSFSPLFIPIIAGELTFNKHTWRS